MPKAARSSRDAGAVNGCGDQALFWSRRSEDFNDGIHAATVEAR